MKKETLAGYKVEHDGWQQRTEREKYKVTATKGGTACHNEQRGYKKIIMLSFILQTECVCTQTVQTHTEMERRLSLQLPARINY